MSSHRIPRSQGGYPHEQSSRAVRGPWSPYGAAERELHNVRSNAKELWCCTRCNIAARSGACDWRTATAGRDHRCHRGRQRGESSRPGRPLWHLSCTAAAEACRWRAQSSPDTSRPSPSSPTLGRCWPAGSSMPRRSKRSTATPETNHKSRIGLEIQTEIEGRDMERDREV